MLQNAYLLAKIGADTAENEQHFAEILPKFGNYPTGPEPRGPRPDDLAAAREDPLDDLPVAFVDRPEQDAPPAVVLLVNGPLFYITLRKDPLALPL